LNEVQKNRLIQSFFGRGAGKPIFAKNGFPAQKKPYGNIIPAVKVARRAPGGLECFNRTPRGDIGGQHENQSVG